MLQQNFAAFFVSDCTCVFSNCNFTHLWGRCNNSSVPAHKTTTHKTPKNSPDFRFWTMQSLATLLMLSVWSLSPTICSAAFCASGVNLFVSSPLMPNVYRCQRESARSTLRMVEEPLFEERNSRRQVLQNAMVSIALGNSVFNVKEAVSAVAPIAIIGASGYTGGDCVRELVARKLPVRAISRKTIPLDNLPSSLVKAIVADVTVPASLPSAIRGSSSVIFLASARKRYSSKGSDSASIDSFEDVEHLGLINVAKECIAGRVPRLVVVSSSCAKCKDGQTDKATGMMCDQCSSKRAGEDAVRELYAQAAIPGVSYTIVRPGLLNTGEKRGVSEIEINQGESKTGVISRLDLADLLIASASSPSTSGTTFECYYRDTAQPVDIRASLGRCKELGKSTQECFFGAGFKDKAPKSLAEALSTPVTGTLFASGREHQGPSFEKMFTGLEPDGTRDIDILDFGFGQS